MLSVRLFVRVSHPSAFESVFMKFGKYEYIMATVPISGTKFIYPSHKSGCLYGTYALLGQYIQDMK
jgi:hypothetical protein